MVSAVSIKFGLKASDPSAIFNSSYFFASVTALNSSRGISNCFLA